MKNEELIKLIVKVDAEAETEGLNNKQLSALLKELTPAEEEPKKAPFEVAPGCAITCKGGILTEGKEVTAAMFGSTEALKAAVKRKLVIANK